VLCNRHTTITLRHERLQIVGLDDAYTGHARRDEAVKGLRHDLPSIALSHIAEEADGLWRHGVPLVLSGHTHAGQVTLARLHEFAVGRLGGHKYVHGLYDRVATRTAPRTRGGRLCLPHRAQWFRSASRCGKRGHDVGTGCEPATLSSTTPSRGLPGRADAADDGAGAAAVVRKACRERGSQTV
jgi:hypothetical protein